MKINREKIDCFQPITITLETIEEVECFQYLLMNMEDAEDKSFRELDDKFGDNWYNAFEKLLLVEEVRYRH